MKNRKIWMRIGVYGIAGIVLLMIILVRATSPSVSAKDVEFEWQNGNWIPVAIQDGDSWKSDFALRHYLYEGRLRWPWHVKISFKTQDGRMTDGAVPKGCLLSNVKGKFNLMPKEKKGQEF